MGNNSPCIFPTSEDSEKEDYDKPTRYNSFQINLKKTKHSSSREILSSKKQNTTPLSRHNFERMPVRRSKIIDMTPVQPHEASSKNKLRKLRA